MLYIGLAMFGVLVIAALVAIYAAFPHRGEEVPGAPWLGEAMTKATEAMPVIPEPEYAAEGEQTPEREYAENDR